MNGRPKSQYSGWQRQQIAARDASRCFKEGTMIVAFCLAGRFGSPHRPHRTLADSARPLVLPAALEPVINRIADDGYRVKHLDIEANQALATKYNVDRVPTGPASQSGRKSIARWERVVRRAAASWLQSAGGTTATLPPAATNQPQPQQPRQDLLASVRALSKQHEQANARAKLCFSLPRDFEPNPTSKPRQPHARSTRLRSHRSLEG